MYHCKGVWLEETHHALSLIIDLNFKSLPLQISEVFFLPYCHPNLSKYLALIVHDVLKPLRDVIHQSWKIGKAIRPIFAEPVTFIVTVHAKSFHVHLNIDTPATVGPATCTKHGWPFKYPYRVLTMALK